MEIMWTSLFIHCVSYGDVKEDRNVARLPAALHLQSVFIFFRTKGLLGPNLYTDGFNPSFVVFSNSVSLPLCKLYTLLVNIQSGCCMTASSSSKHDANEHTVLPLRKLRPTEKVVPVPNEERHVAV